LRLLHHAVDLDGPRPQLERLRRLDDVLARAEFIEIIVAGIDPLLGDGTVEREFFIASDGIKILRRVGQIAHALSERCRGCKRKGRCRCKEAAPAEKHVLGRGVPFGYLPSAAANHVHGTTSFRLDPR
jgi:hypothetical protein